MWQRIVWEALSDDPLVSFNMRQLEPENNFKKLLHSIATLLNSPFRFTRKGADSIASGTDN
jgi:hypothetical protein